VRAAGVVGSGEASALRRGYGAEQVAPLHNAFWMESQGAVFKNIWESPSGASAQNSGAALPGDFLLTLIIVE